MAPALAIGFALAVLTPDTPPATAPTLRGVIVRVDLVSDRIHVVATGGREFWFASGPEVAVTIAGEPASLGELRPGFPVKVTYDPWTFTALRIDAQL